MSLKQRLSPFLVLIEARYLPLLVLVAPQAFAVYLWLLESNRGEHGATAVAMIGAAALEFTYVGSIAWAESAIPEAKHLNRWVWGTAVLALLFSVAVAIDVYWAKEGIRSFLHAGFPLVAFGYTMVVHTVSKPVLAVPATEAISAYVPSEPSEYMQEQAKLFAAECEAAFPDWYNGGVQASQALVKQFGKIPEAGSKTELHILKEAYKAGELTDSEAIAQGVKPNTLASWRSRYRKVKVIE